MGFSFKQGLHLGESIRFKSCCLLASAAQREEQTGQQDLDLVLLLPHRSASACCQGQVSKYLSRRAYFRERDCQEATKPCPSMQRATKQTGGQGVNEGLLWKEDTGVLRCHRPHPCPQERACSLRCSPTMHPTCQCAPQACGSHCPAGTAPRRQKPQAWTCCE